MDTSTGSVSTKRKLKIWQYFTDQPGFMAICNFCKQRYSYRCSTSNLDKHLVRKHSKYLQMDVINFETIEDDDNGDKSNDVDTDDESQELQEAMKNYDLVETAAGERMAMCQTCNQIEQISVKALRNHSKEHSTDALDDGQNDSAMKSVTVKRKSETWQYFTDKPDCMATCNFCKNDYSYKGGISNLNRHLKRKHAKYLKMGIINIDTIEDEEIVDKNNDVDIDDESQELQEAMNTFDIVETADGERMAWCKTCNQIEAISVKALQNHSKEHCTDIEDNGKTDIVMKNNRRRSAVWNFMRKCGDGKYATCLLCYKKLSCMNTVSNLKKHMVRVHSHIKIENIDIDGKNPIEMDTIYLEETEFEDDDDTFRNETPPPPKKMRKKEIAQASAQDKCQTSNDTIDTNDNKKSDNQKCLESFSRYVVSLLSDLPTYVSDQLQIEIIKQIIATKTSLQAPSYSISVSNSQPTVASVTVSQSNSMPEIMLTNDSNEVQS